MSHHLHYWCGLLKLQSSRCPWPLSLEVVSFWSPWALSALTSTGPTEAMAWGLPSQSQAELCSWALGRQVLVPCKVRRRLSLLFTSFFVVRWVLYSTIWTSQIPQLLVKPALPTFICISSLPWPQTWGRVSWRRVSESSQGTLDPCVPGPFSRRELQWWEEGEALRIPEHMEGKFGQGLRLGRRSRKQHCLLEESHCTQISAHYLLAVCPWASYLTTLCPMIIKSNSQGWCED